MRRVAAPPTASHVVGCRSECSWSPPCEANWVSFSPPWCYPQAHLRGIEASPSIHLLRSGIILSWALPPLQSSFLPNQLASCDLSAFLEVSFSVATSVHPVHVAGVPKRTAFRPQRFSRSRRFAPRQTLLAVSKQPRARFSLQGVSPPTRRADSSPAHPLMPFARASTTGVCSTWRSVARAWGLVRRASLDPLLGFVLP